VRLPRPGPRVRTAHLSPSLYSFCMRRDCARLASTRGRHTVAAARVHRWDRWHGGVGVSCESTQPPPTVAFVTSRSEHASLYVVDAFRKGLGETGYIEDRNVTVEYHWLDGQFDRLPALMADIVRRRVAVIATPSNTLIRPQRKQRQRQSRLSSASPQTLSKLALSRALPGRVAMPPASIISPWRCRQSGWRSCGAGA
jgi:hypothetical protein